MNSWVYFNKCETLALGKSTTVIISGIDNFPHCEIYKSSFSIFLNTDQQADSVHICFAPSTQLTQASSSETLASQVEEGAGAWSRPSRSHRWTTAVQSECQSWWYGQRVPSRHLVEIQNMSEKCTIPKSVILSLEEKQSYL